jgi:hypothetical protein
MSIFDVFRGQPGSEQPAGDSPLSLDDLGAMGGGVEGPSFGSAPDLAVEAEGPDTSTMGPDRAEMRDFLLERAKAREQRSLEYQEQARQANGLK